MKAGPSAADLAGMLFDRRADWLQRYFPAGRVRGNVFYLGDADGSPGDSLPIPLYRQPRLTDFGGGFSGDDLALLGRAIGAGDDMAKAYREAMTYLGLAPGTTTPPRPPPPKPPPIAPEDFDEIAARAERLWYRTVPITPDHPAGRYLLGRGCALPHPDGDLRCVDELRHKSGWTGPALVALVTDPATGEAMTLHRTWLQPDGSGKAPLQKPRGYMFGLPKLGGVVRLWPDGEVSMGLLVAEEIETALSAALAFVPVWSTLDKGNLEVLPVLAGVDGLTILADHDDDGGGRMAAETCGRRWSDAGCDVWIWEAPTEGHDFNDLVRTVA